MNIRAIREAFGMRKGEFARCLGVAPNTITRWESGHGAGHEPVGLARAVLQAMETAIDKLSPDEALMKGAQLKLGLGAFIYYELKRLVT